MEPDVAWNSEEPQDKEATCPRLQVSQRNWGALSHLCPGFQEEWPAGKSVFSGRRVGGGRYICQL